MSHNIGLVQSRVKMSWKTEVLNQPVDVLNWHALEAVFSLRNSNSCRPNVSIAITLLENYGASHQQINTAMYGDNHDLFIDELIAQKINKSQVLEICETFKEDCPDAVRKELADSTEKHFRRTTYLEMPSFYTFLIDRNIRVAKCWKDVAAKLGWTKFIYKLKDGHKRSCTTTYLNNFLAAKNPSPTVKDLQQQVHNLEHFGAAESFDQIVKEEIKSQSKYVEDVNLKPFLSDNTPIRSR